MGADFAGDFAVLAADFYSGSAFGRLVGSRCLQQAQLGIYVACAMCDVVDRVHLDVFVAPLIL